MTGLENWLTGLISQNETWFFSVRYMITGNWRISAWGLISWTPYYKSRKLGKILNRNFPRLVIISLLALKCNIQLLNNDTLILRIQKSQYSNRICIDQTLSKLLKLEFKSHTKTVLVKRNLQGRRKRSETKNQMSAC